MPWIWGVCAAIEINLPNVEVNRPKTLRDSIPLCLLAAPSCARGSVICVYKCSRVALKVSPKPGRHKNLINFLGVLNVSKVYAAKNLFGTEQKL